MIKYADRGLIDRSSGSVLPLFETLYCVVYASLLSVFLIFALYYYLSKDPNKKSNYHLMCIKQSADSDFQSTKSLNLLLALTVPFFIILISMFCSIIYIYRLKKRNVHIIGNYRRNILTLTETFLYTIFVIVLIFIYYVLLRFHTVFGFSVDGIRIFAFTHSLVIHQLLEGIIWPVYILWKMYDKMPELYSDKEHTVQKFYISGQHKIVPRRKNDDTEEIYYKSNIQRKVPSIFTFQHSKTDNNSCSELPPIV